MNFPFYIARRYVRSKSSQNAVNVINFITFLVIVIGSAALFIVLSGFAGLKTFSLSFSNTFDPDLKAVPATGKFFQVSPETYIALQEVEGIDSFSREIEERVYITHQKKSDVAYIKGVDELYASATRIDSTIYWGQWNIDNQRTVVGLGIANLLGLTLDNFRSPLVVLAPKPGEGTLGTQGFNAKPYNELSLVLSGVYALEENLDKKYVFTDLRLVQALLEKDSTQLSGINFRLLPTANAEELGNTLQDLLGPEVQIKTRRQLNQTLYRMLNTENLATYLIFTLVLIIALFNVVGAIIMMILDKQQNSRTLFSLGTTLKEIRRIYFIQGVIVTSMGGIIGIVLGSLLILSQLAFGWLKITPSLAYPVEYQFVNVLIVLGTIVVLGLIASKVASRRVNKKLLS
ncbi:ABC transporter permease [Lentiprolixibacter aurantiacus]|uniref:ABC transporter permease n=1 Tax=Lentiprolixibacter aurantiacus TaxID=2993939 RepID=A0AAE3MJB9_9FLAO|nr:FtsX-like permease family protein [Lentiprolixibacter aurantiacus]MCX2718483.1 ABC transporter permease [Lentiprolixibacter aurantiacus]